MRENNNHKLFKLHRKEKNEGQISAKHQGCRFRTHIA